MSLLETEMQIETQKERESKGDKSTKKKEIWSKVRKKLSLLFGKGISSIHINWLLRHDKVSNSINHLFLNIPCLFFSLKIEIPEFSEHWILF